MRNAKRACDCEVNETTMTDTDKNDRKILDQAPSSLSLLSNDHSPFRKDITLV